MSNNIPLTKTGDKEQDEVFFFFKSRTIVRAKIINEVLSGGFVSSGVANFLGPLYIMWLFFSPQNRTSIFNASFFLNS